jgi:hypothetical protein
VWAAITGCATVDLRLLAAQDAFLIISQFQTKTADTPTTLDGRNLSKAFTKIAHALVQEKSGRRASPIFFGPGTLWRTWGTRPDTAEIR